MAALAAKKHPYARSCNEKMTKEKKKFFRITISPNAILRDAANATNVEGINPMRTIFQTPKLGQGASLLR